MWVLPQQQLCFQEYLQHAAWKYLSQVLSLWQVSQHARAHTHFFFPPLEKVNHDRGLWKWQTHKQPESGASGSAGLCRIYGRWNWTMKSHFKNFSQTSAKLHPQNLTMDVCEEVLTHIHCQVLLCCKHPFLQVLSHHLFLQDHISLNLIIRERVVLESGYTFLATSSQIGV